MLQFGISSSRKANNPSPESQCNLDAAGLGR